MSAPQAIGPIRRVGVPTTSARLAVVQNHRAAVHSSKDHRPFESVAVPACTLP
jgi:hypothetical protein